MFENFGLNKARILNKWLMDWLADIVSKTVVDIMMAEFSCGIVPGSKMINDVCSGWVPATVMVVVF